MPSELKSETARINGAKSRGPVTVAGREKSSQNATTHGLTSGSAVVLACEVQEDFDAIMNHFVATYKPANPAELDLVEEMVAARWRIRRMWTIETSLLDTEILKQQAISTTHDPTANLGLAFRALADESRSLALAARYETRLHRTFDQAYKTLRELQQARESQPQPAEPPVAAAAPATVEIPEAANAEPSSDAQPSPSHNRPHLVQTRPSLSPNQQPQSPVPSPNQDLRNEPTASSPEPPITA